jgi:DNA-directed RNA polymerase specialized sigma subunit
MTDGREAKIVELRFFSGMTTDETAAELGVSPDTVLRDWTHAKAWLTREIVRGRKHEN